MKKFLFLFMTFIMNAQYAFCEETAFAGSLDSSLKTTSHSGGTGIGTVIFSLIFVICLIYITGIIYTRLNALGAKTVKKQLKNYKLDNIIMLSTLQLGQGKNLHVVETNGKKILVGSTANSVNLIKDLGDDEEFLDVSDVTASEEMASDEVKEDTSLNDDSIENVESEENIVPETTVDEEKSTVKIKFEENDNFDLYKKYL